MTSDDGHGVPRSFGGTSEGFVSGRRVHVTHGGAVGFEVVHSRVARDADAEVVEARGERGGRGMNGLVEAMYAP